MTNAGYTEEKQSKLTNKKFKQYDSNNYNEVSLEEFATVNRASKASTKSEKTDKKMNRYL